MADALEQRQHVLVEDELEQGIVPRDHFSCATTVEQDLRAGLGGLARAHMRQHAAIAGHALDQNLQLAAGSLLAKQPRRDDPRIVEDHQITGPHVVQQIGKVAVRHLPGPTVEHQQPARSALGKWMTGDQGVGELEVEIGDLHGRFRGAERAQMLSERRRAGHAKRLTTQPRIPILRRHCASMAESVDAADSKSAVGNNVRVRVSLGAPSQYQAFAQRAPYRYATQAEAPALPPSR